MKKPIAAKATAIAIMTAAVPAIAAPLIGWPLVFGVISPAVEAEGHRRKIEMNCVQRDICDYIHAKC